MPLFNPLTVRLTYALGPDQGQGNHSDSSGFGERFRQSYFCLFA